MFTADTHRLQPRTPVLAAFFAYALLMRVAPYLLHETLGYSLRGAYDAYPWNFSPLYALAVFGGAMFSLRYVWAAPLAVFVVGDLLIAAIQGGEWGFYAAQPFTYLAILAVAACGLPLRSRLRPSGIAAAGSSGAVAFFLVTNFGVWATGGGLQRPLTPAGLLSCYIDALPFLAPTLVSMAIFLPVLFSPLVLAPAARPITGDT